MCLQKIHVMHMTKIFTSFQKKRKFGFVRADRSDWSVLADTENNNSSFNLSITLAQYNTLLSVETHRRVATGNTKSREVARALAGTAPSSTARKFRHTPGGFVENRACHLTYTRSGGCRRAPNSFLHTKTHVNVSPSRGRFPGTTLASALKSRSSPSVRLDL